MSSSVRLNYHEAGHALIARALGRPLDLVALGPDGGMIKATSPLAGEGSPEALEESLVVTFAGEIAERYAPSSPLSMSAALHADSNGGPDPFAGLLTTSEHELTEQPSDDELVEHYRARLGDEVIERARALAVELVDRKAVLGDLELVADRLLLAGLLTSDDLDRILAHA